MARRCRLYSHDDEDDHVDDDDVDDGVGRRRGPRPRRSPRCDGGDDAMMVFVAVAMVVVRRCRTAYRNAKLLRHRGRPSPAKAGSSSRVELPNALYFSLSLTPTYVRLAREILPRYRPADLYLSYQIANGPESASDRERARAMRVRFARGDRAAAFSNVPPFEQSILSISANRYLANRGGISVSVFD